jgi:hypothetical protein
MSRSIAMPAWPRAVAWWHAAVFLTATIGFYFAPVTFFGDAAYLQLGRLAASAVAAVLLALSVLLVMALLSGSKSKLRLALFTAFILDVQIPFLLATHMASIEILEARAGVPALLALLLSILALPVPSGLAVLALREKLSGSATA